MGRKVKSINEMTTIDEVLERIRTQTNTLNKKIPFFRENDILTFEDILEAYIGDNIKTRKNGLYSTGKKQFEGMNIIKLKMIASSLTEINNSKVYGSEKRFKKHADRGMQWIHEYIVTEFVEKGDYDREYVLSRLMDANFNKYLLECLNSKDDYIPSEQVIKQVFLDYDVNEYTEATKKRKKNKRVIENNLNEGRNKMNR